MKPPALHYRSYRRTAEAARENKLTLAIITEASRRKEEGSSQLGAIPPGNPVVARGILRKPLSPEREGEKR